MLKLSKKLIALLVVAMLAITSLVGCGSKEPEALDESAVVMTIGDAKITAGMMNFYVRYQQSLVESVYQSYLGDDVWKQEVEGGVTYEESMKDAFLERFQEMYIIYSHAADYNVELTESEKKTIDETATAFAEANSKDAKEKVSATKEYAAEYMTMLLVNDKMEDAMKRDIDTDLSNVVKTQKRMRYVVWEFEKTVNGTTTTLSDDEIKEVKKEAKDLLAGAKEKGSLETYCTENEVESFTLTFDAETTDLDEKVMEAANKLKEGEYSEVIEAEDGIYVLQLETEFDSEATDAALKEVLEERGQERYDELVKEWKEAVKIKVNEDVWAKISLDALKVNSITPEVEEDTTEDTDASTDTATE